MNLGLFHAISSSRPIRLRIAWLPPTIWFSSLSSSHLSDAHKRSSNTRFSNGNCSVKARCKQSHSQAIDILLGTDAASEGLNLQEFSALVNYDLPWNPMRVEQRIGRIDRIGQSAKIVLIANLYMTGTIEQDTYRALMDRIGVFENVVGPLQPILAQMPRIFRKLAQGEIERSEALRQLDAAQHQQASAVADAIEHIVDDADLAISSIPALPATQKELAYWCMQHPASGMLIRSIPKPDGEVLTADGAVSCLAITWPYAPPHLGVGGNEGILATFSGELADRHPPTGPTTDFTGVEQPGHEGIRLLTWGRSISDGLAGSGARRQVIYCLIPLTTWLICLTAAQSVQSDTSRKSSYRAWS